MSQPAERQFSHSTEAFMLRQVTYLRLLTSTVAFCLIVPALAAEPQSPDMVKNGLHILAGIYGDMDRKLAAQQYDRLPHENQEFQEGSRALWDAVAHDPAAFKDKVEAALEAPVSRSTPGLLV